MPNRSSIPWRLKTFAALASATLSMALAAVFTSHRHVWLKKLR